jgi:hypothetical protein
MPNLNYIDLSNNNLGTLWTSPVVKQLLKLPYVMKINVNDNFPIEGGCRNDLNKRREKIKIKEMAEERNSSAIEISQPIFQKLKILKLSNCLVPDLVNIVEEKLIGKAVEQDTIHTVDVTYE